MNYCNISAEIDRHLSKVDSNESFSEAVHAEVNSLLSDRNEVAEAIDAILASSDFTLEGNSTFSSDLAAAICAPAKDTEAMREWFFTQITPQIVEELSSRAITNIRALEAAASSDHADYRRQQIEDREI